MVRIGRISSSVTKKEISIRSMPPSDYPWSLFSMEKLAST